MRTSMHLTNTTRITFDASPPAIEISDTITGDSIVLHLPHMAHVRRHLLEALASEALRFSRELGPAPDPIRPPSADARTFVAPELRAEPTGTVRHMAINHPAAFEPRHDADGHDDAMMRSLADGDHFAGMPDGVVIPFLMRGEPEPEGV